MFDPSSYHAIQFDRSGRILTIRLNRPEQLNAANEQMHTELARVFREAGQGHLAPDVVPDRSQSCTASNRYCS